MSRIINTKKIIKDVLNDMYALVIGNEIILDSKIEITLHQRTVIHSEVEVLLKSSFGSDKEMAKPYKVVIVKQSDILFFKCC